MTQGAGCSELTSKTITAVRFPLIVLVVMIHAQFYNVIVGGHELRNAFVFPFYRELSILISEIIAQIAVPLFYAIAGYLFFIKTQRFTVTEYLAKLKRRARTLLVPYLLWNAIVVVMYLLAQTFVPQLYTESVPVADYTLKDWYHAFWGNPDNANMPICFQMWFIRDLMVTMVFSPLIYLLIKRMGWLYIVLLAAVWVLFERSLPLIGFSLMSFLFFSIGAICGLRKMDVAQLLVPGAYTLAAIYAIMAAAIMLLPDGSMTPYLTRVTKIVGVSMFVAMYARSVLGGMRPNTRLSRSSFFVYAYHGAVLACLLKVVFKVVPLNAVTAVMVYFIAPALVIVLGLLIYYLLKRFVPVVADVLTGDR